MYVPPFGVRMAYLLSWRLGVWGLPRNWLRLGSLVMAVPIVALLLPYAAAAYHLEVGGRVLEAVLGEIDPLNWWYAGSIAIEDSPRLTEAIGHLEKATPHTQALRLIGRAYAARGDLVSSIEALERFTAQRPDSPIGHLELAAAYVRADQRLQGMYSVGLLAALPGAEVAAPDLSGETPYQAEGWHSAYVYPTAFLLSPDEVERPTLFLHAGSQVTYTLTLTEPCVLSFGMGLDPRSLDWGGDGVTFEVWVDGKWAFMEHLPVEVARAGWQARQVDLSAYVGRTIALTLASTPGPAGDVTADWAGWGDPRVEEAEAAAYRRLVRGDPWEGEWKRAGITAQDFVNAGEAARKAERYEEALGWYEWAVLKSPSSGFGYRELAKGLIYKENGSWTEALAAFQGVLAWAKSSDDALAADLYYHLGQMQQDDLSQWEAALASLDQALALREHLSELQLADAYYRKGVILKHSGREREAMQAFGQAVATLPYHYGALIELGAAYWVVEGDFGLAEETLLLAIGASSEGKWAYIALGDLYRTSDMIVEALAMYEAALERDPADEQIRQRIQEIQQK